MEVKERIKEPVFVRTRSKPRLDDTFLDTKLNQSKFKPGTEESITGVQGDRGEEGERARSDAPPRLWS